MYKREETLSAQKASSVCANIKTQCATVLSGPAAKFVFGWRENMRVCIGSLHVNSVIC